jgi:hypothetical protein
MRPRSPEPSRRVMEPDREAWHVLADEIADELVACSAPMLPKSPQKFTILSSQRLSRTDREPLEPVGNLQRG